MSISGKVALVTGAGQGIGRAIALRLAHDGTDIPPSVSRATPLASPLAVLPYGACPAPE